METKERHNDYKKIKEITDEGPKNIASLVLIPEKAEESITLVKSGIKKIKTILAGEYLTVVLNVFYCKQCNSFVVNSDGVD